MKGYRTSHRDFSFSVELASSLSHMKGSSFVISKAPLESLFARIVADSSGESVRHVLTRLRDTPHFAFLQGNRNAYQQYMEAHGRNVGYGLEHSADAFEKLLSSSIGYLDPPHTSSYIICEVVDTDAGKRAVILDGV